MQSLVVFAVIVHGVLAVAPVFTTPANAADRIPLSELAKGGDSVLTLAAMDTDSPAASLVYTMESSVQATRDLFEIPSNTNTLKVNATVAAGTFNYEIIGAREYDIVLSVTDGTDTTNLETKIYVKDINEFTPIFSGTEPFTDNVLESAKPGTSVYRVTATDADGTNQITYALSGALLMSGAPAFVINPGTGVISVAPDVAFNLTTTPDYTATVTATDHGEPTPKAKATTVKFTIVTNPVFVNLASSTTTNINENVAADTPVFAIEVSDKDTPTESLTVSIKRQQPNNNLFKIVNKTLVTSTNTLNAEAQQSYTFEFEYVTQTAKITLELEVTDALFATESATLTVNVIDLNDNTPVITPVSPVTIPENKAVGSTSVVVDVAATDADATSPNNATTYSITSGNTDLFGIIPSNGIIYLVTAPKSMSVSQYILKVKVTDGGTPPRATTTDITVNINPNTVNECSPNPCQNSGVCTSFVNDYSCACGTTGFTGTTCQTNINDCTSTSCMNGGACVDGVNKFTCNCAAGYIGTTCTQACTNNKYGSGCAQTCSCNASRLIENVGTQQCNHQTGACACNAKWTGSACQTDVDECTNANLCTAVANQVCENTAGSYYCTCKQGYRLNTANTCEIVTTVATLTAGANEFKVTAEITLDLPCVTADLEVPSKYAALKAAIELKLQTKVRPTRRVLVTNIRCGSVLFDTTIIISDTDAAKSQLASDLQDLRNGETVAVNGVNTKTTAITVNGNTVGVTSGTSNTGTKVCQVYVTYVTCPTGQTCQYVGSTAACRTIPEEEEDNNDLILGLGLGIGLPLILIILIAVVVWFWMNNKKQYDKRRRRGMSARDSYVMDWADDYRRSYDRPRNDYFDYLDKREYYGLPSTGGYRY